MCNTLKDQLNKLWIWLHIVFLLSSPHGSLRDDWQTKQGGQRYLDEFQIEMENLFWWHPLLWTNKYLLNWFSTLHVSSTCQIRIYCCFQASMKKLYYFSIKIIPSTECQVYQHHNFSVQTLISDHPSDFSQRCTGLNILNGPLCTYYFRAK